MTPPTGQPTPPRYEARAQDHAGTSYGVWDSFPQTWVEFNRHPTRRLAETAANQLNRAYDSRPWDQAT